MVAILWMAETLVMASIPLNRRRFLGYSAAASLALAQGNVSEATGPARAVRLGFVGLGNRGTALLRAAMEQPGVEVVAVADAEEKHRVRASGIVEKAGRKRPEPLRSVAELLARDDVEAVVSALPCDLHASCYVEAIRAGKHLYGEKPLALSPEDCTKVIAEAARHSSLAVHIGHQRRSNPRYRAGVDLIRARGLGDLIEARAALLSSNGPILGHQGWLGRRERSGDWMVEQAVHVWDVLHWIAGGPPASAVGVGRAGLFADRDPGRDVTDWYQVRLSWADSFHASFTQSWIDPADADFTGNTLRVVGDSGGFDFGTGAATFRDRNTPRQTLHPGNLADTGLAIAAFLGAVRAEAPVAPPISLDEARDAVVTGWMVRAAVDSGRTVTRGEAENEGGPA